MGCGAFKPGGTGNQNGSQNKNGDVAEGKPVGVLAGVPVPLQVFGQMTGLGLRRARLE
jgi:hypothetical protein